MNFIIDNWAIILGAIAIIVVAAYAIAVFLKMPRATQIEKVKQWLLYAVVQAEKEFGSGTGKIKLRYVYDMFIVRFPWMAQVITFETFSGLVDKALEEMRVLLETNKQVQLYVTD